MLVVTVWAAAERERTKVSTMVSGISSLTGFPTKTRCDDASLGPSGPISANSKEDKRALAFNLKDEPHATAVRAIGGAP